ncbi:cytochrome c2 [Neorhizobium sp. 2083]|uniref:c-type cytochrome n=1 Tax=Neorhizobium sp. 2083 TaxID=2817762 RepID=UPI0028616207|nr:c-type cytochrome [Neorhizobium sp. 2083]MDR6820982.1 cytochrome c2 [Neorhizobium sp. 2083]
MAAFHKASIYTALVADALRVENSLDPEGYLLKKLLILSGAVLVLAAVVGMPYVTHDETGDESEVASSPQLVAPPPKDTFAPVFAPCAHCHQIGPGARNSTGPVLTGVIDRPAASTAYPYSSAMRNSGLVWDETTLHAFLKNPHKLVPGTRMALAGLSDAQIDTLLDYIRSVGSSP